MHFRKVYKLSIDNKWVMEWLMSRRTYFCSLPPWKALPCNTGSRFCWCDPFPPLCYTWHCYCSITSSIQTLSSWSFNSTIPSSSQLYVHWWPSLDYWGRKNSCPWIILKWYTLTCLLNYYWLIFKSRLAVLLLLARCGSPAQIAKRPPASIP